MDKKLQGLLADVFGVRESEIAPETVKEDVESWDSLKQMDLVMSLERAYDLTLDIQDIVAMTSVAAIAQVLRDKGVRLED
ncbi:acyl carrier protein [uncultured Desulfovibrio sp.]|uniref:acyl carrier protein n=1 Tax=uncultured Desulfovibrio sp. TaxID=167968 RepID=UPI0003A95DCB|nr:acyl carrier protein [uncultured Desulfovibrio sp.]